MNRYAVVIPADITVPVRLEEWPGPEDQTQLSFMQRLVDGFIEVVHLLRLPGELGKGVIMIINEEGKLTGKAGNARATAVYAYGYSDIICGDAILAEDHAPDTTGLTQFRAEQLRRHIQGLGEPRSEVFPG